MKKKEFKLMIKEELTKHLIFSKFKIRLFSDAIILKENSSKNINRIAFSYLEVNDVILCKNFNAGIIYKEIENSLDPIMVKNGLIGKVRLNNPQATIRGNKYYDEDKELKEDFSIVLNNPNEMKTIIGTLEYLHEHHYKGFFNEYSDTNKLFELMKPMTLRELGMNYGTGGVFKKAILLHKHEHSQFPEYINNLISLYTISVNEDPEEERKQGYLQTAIDLKMSLKN